MLTLLLALAQVPGLPAARHALDSLAGSIPGHVGAAAMIIETGAMVSTHGNERFPMQSVYKLPIAMAVLQRIDAGKLKLGEEIHIKKSDMIPGIHSPIRDMSPGGTRLSTRELLRSAIVESDGVASDMLLVWSPPADVTKMLRKAGVDSMTVATSERAMAADAMVQYKNWSTPVGAVQLLRALYSGHALSAPSKALLIGWLTESTSGDKRIKALLPPGTAVAHKTGTDATRNGMTRATNDIGIVTLPSGQHLAIAVCVKDSKATEAQRESVIAQIAKAAWSVANRKTGK